MNRIVLTATLLVIFSCHIFHVNAQDKTITGVVTTFESIAVNGAEVHIKSTKQVVKTDSLGKFTAKVANKEKLKIVAKGFFTKKLELTKQTKLVAVNLQMKTGDKAREYAIGYGYVKDAEKLTAVSKLSSKDLDFSQYASITDAIRGRISGVVINSNGEIIIRGENPMNGSSEAALIVIDGDQANRSALNLISTSNVKSINVIKDGSASIYGARGVNGVVLVETKSGQNKL